MGGARKILKNHRKVIHQVEASKIAQKSRFLASYSQERIGRRPVPLPLRSFSDSLRLAFSVTAHGLNGFGTRFGHEHNRAAFVTEGTPHLVPEIFFVLGGKQILAVDKEKKSWRRKSDLRGIKEFQTMSVRADRLAVLDRILQRSIENRRGDFLLQLRSHIPHRLEE